MKILFLSRWFPFPANNGSKIRIYHLLRGLSQIHDVSLLSFYDPGEGIPNVQDPLSFCSEVQVVPWKPFNVKSRKAVLGFFSIAPRSILDTYSFQMESLIRKAVSSQKIDLIIASQLGTASYYPCFGSIPAIFEEVELGFFRDQAFKNRNWMSRLRLRLTWFKLRRYFLRLLDSFAACTVVSEQERQILAEYFPQFEHKVHVLPNCIAIDDYQGIKVKPGEHRLIFTGSFRYEPNLHAMEWFVNEVYPLILKQVSDVQLIITGDHANLPLPRAENIMLTGQVGDVKSLIASSDVSLAPLWSGGGTRIKILEAMAIGTPVVATTKGAEGLLVQNGKHILIADQPERFAEYVINILRDRELHDHISTNAFNLVKQNYNWATAMPKLLGLMEKAVLV